MYSPYSKISERKKLRLLQVFYRTGSQRCRNQDFVVLEGLTEVSINGNSDKGNGCLVVFVAKHIEEAFGIDAETVRSTFRLLRFANLVGVSHHNRTPSARRTLLPLFHHPATPEVHCCLQVLWLIDLHRCTPRSPPKQQKYLMVAHPRTPRR